MVENNAYEERFSPEVDFDVVSEGPLLTTCSPERKVLLRNNKQEAQQYQVFAQQCAHEERLMFVLCLST